MAGNRITLTLDQPFTEMVGEGWGASKLAGAFTFNAGFDDDKKPIASAIPKGYWQVPTLGVMTLMPRHLVLGQPYVGDASNLVFQLGESKIAKNESGSDALSSLEVIGGFTRTRATREDTLIALLVTVTQQAILTEASERLRVVWQTKDSLLPNEGFGCVVAPRRIFDQGNLDNYVAIPFGQFYVMGIDLQGTAVLSERVNGSVITRKRMDLGAVGVDPTRPWSLTVIPVGGRYIVFRFGNIRSGLGAYRLQQYLEYRDFRFDVVKEGRGNRWDAGIKQYVCLEGGKFNIAINYSNTDYSFTPFKLRYDAPPEDARLAPEPLPYPVPGQTPELTPRGYAAGYTQGGAGVLNVTYQNENGEEWDDDSTWVCPIVHMEPSANKVWTPELWFYDAAVDPQTHTPNWTPYDASPDWTYLRFARSIDPHPCAAEVTMKGEGRYDRLFQRGGPFRIAIDGEPVFDGYFHTRRPTLGPTLIEEEGNARDMWERLSVSCGSFESLDGKGIGQTLHRLLRRCGFTDEEISIEDDDLQGLTFGDFDEPQSLKLYNDDTLVCDAIRDIIEHTGLQGVEGIRCRWDGAKWRVYLAKRQGTGDPTLILYSTEDWTTSDGHPLGALSEAERWARTMLRITSHLETDVQNPEFNALTGKCASEGGYASAIVIPPPTEEIESTLANNPDNPRAQAFEGRLRSKNVGPPQITANTFFELRRQMRFIYDDEMSKTLGEGVQAEWQPFADADMECAMIGKNPITGQTVSYGVWAVEHIDVDVHADDQNEKNPDGTDRLDGEGEPIVVRRAHEWSGAYRLRWRRATTEDFVVPMFGGVLPPERY